jgi:hypothetical protein
MAPRATPPTNAQRLERSLFFGVLLVGIGFLTFLAVRASSPPKAQGCPALPAPALTVMPAGQKPTTLKLQSSGSTELAFGRAVGRRDLIIEYAPNGQVPADLANAGPETKIYLYALVSELNRSDGQAIDTTGAGKMLVEADAYYQAGRVYMQLCVDRRPPQRKLAGTYQGTLSLVDPHANRVDVPVTVTAEWPNWALVVLLMLIGIIGATWYVWVLHVGSGSDGGYVRSGKSFGWLWPFVDWCVTMLGLLSIGVGTVAAVGVFTSQYLNNGTWGSKPNQPLALLGASFAAFIAVAAGLKIGAIAAARNAAPGDESPPNPDDQEQPLPPGK